MNAIEALEDPGLTSPSSERFAAAVDDGALIGDPTSGYA
jgi:hypothetical protein